MDRERILQSVEMFVGHLLMLGKANVSNRYGVAWIQNSGETRDLIFVSLEAPEVVLPLRHP